MTALPIADICNGVHLITANRRLASYLRFEYDMEVQKKGVQVWSSPHIIPWMAWLERLREETRPERPIISDLRARTLWEEIVRTDPLLRDEGVFVEGGVIKSAYEAYKLMREYRLPFPEEGIYSTRESASLGRWIALYNEKVSELGFMDRLDLIDEISSLVEGAAIKTPGKIIIAGFDEITPAMSKLFGVFEKQGCTVDFWPSRPDAVKATEGEYLLPKDLNIELYEDELEEVIHTARWIRRTYRPGIKIGIIVPDLNSYREMIRREFVAELNPASSISGEDANGVFNISLGESLLDAPIVRFALNLLSLHGRSHDVDAVSATLLSPFVAKTAVEGMALAAIDAALKKENRLSISMRELQAMVSEEDAPFMAALLDEVVKTGSNKGSKRLPSRWSKEFDLLMRRFVHPVKGDNRFSSEYQAIAAFCEVLSSFASLDDITGLMARDAAIARLKKMTGEKIHQPETAGSPVEVMGLLESSGISFDYVRLMGAHDKALPGDPSPNPFIPLHLQKSFGLPRSSYDRELGFAAIQLERIIKSAGSFSVTAPKKLNRMDVGLSSLFNGRGRKSGMEEKRKGSRQIDLVHGMASLEDMPCHMAVPVLEEEVSGIKGGTFILKNQSDCPFRAFAVHRLLSTGVAEPEAGITPMERGNIVHKSMEIFWERTQDSPGLQRLIDEGSLEKAIADAARRGLKLAGPARKLGKSYLELEMERLVTLMREWLEIEATRGQFSAVTRESEKNVLVSGLPLRARIDRIDELASGERVLIDYKTGSSGPNDWLTGRPKEPQLMLYAISGDYGAVTFARLKRGESRFAGIAKDDGMLPGVTRFGSDTFSKNVEGATCWEGLMDEWRDSVEGLGEDFMKGEALVDPRGYGKEDSACRYCDQKALCRIFEAE